MYRVEYERAASRELGKLPRQIQARIVEAIEELAEEPRPPGSRKMAGTVNGHRIRAGDYRVLYDIRDDVLIVAVIRVGKRDQVYRRS